MTGVAFSWPRFLLTLKKTIYLWVPLILFIILVINALGLFLPKKYESTAQVRIYAPLYSDMMGTADGVLTIKDRLVTIREEMTSFKFLSAIAHKVNIDAGIAPGSLEHEELIQRMTRSISLHLKGQDLFTISYRDSTPELAYKVTLEIVTQYLINSNHYYERRTSDRITFIAEQLKDATVRLDKAQEGTLAYKNEHINEIPEAQNANQRRMEQLRTEHLGVRQQLSALKETLILAKTKLVEIEPEIIAEIIESENDGRLLGLKNQKQQLELALDMKLKVFTENHWEVEPLQSQLTLLDEQIALAEDKKEQTITRTPNPAYQSLEDTITRTELDIQRYQTRSQRLQADITTLEKYNARIPQSKLDLSQLESEQRFAENRVDTLRTQLEDAKLAGHLEQQGQGPSFDQMDPPRRPTAASSPNRKKIAAASVVVGFGAGGALILLLTLLDTAVRTMKEARQILQMPVLGVVQQIVTPTEQRRLRRRKILRICVASTGLVTLAIVLTLSLTVYHQPLMEGVQTLRNLINERLSP